MSACVDHSSMDDMRLPVERRYLSGTAKYIVGRVLLGFAQIAAVMVVVFFLTNALPGDAAVTSAGDNPDPALIGQLRQQLGLDRPILQRFTDWAGGLLELDLGGSLVGSGRVVDVIANAIGPTALVAVLTLLAVVPISLFLGMYAANREGRLVDRAISSVALGMYSVPEFALAVVLVAVFSIQLGWFPPSAIGMTNLLANPVVLVIPVVVLLTRPICSLSRLIRAGMVDSLRSSYVRQARRLGLSKLRIQLAHALPNAIPAAVQQLARTTDWLVGGVIVIEAIFVIPGLGTSLMEAISNRDIPVVQGLAMLFATTTIVVNLCADIVARAIAPGSLVAR